MFDGVGHAGLAARFGVIQVRLPPAEPGRVVLHRMAESGERGRSSPQLAKYEVSPPLSLSLTLAARSWAAVMPWVIFPGSPVTGVQPESSACLLRVGDTRAEEFLSGQPAPGKKSWSWVSLASVPRGKGVELGEGQGHRCCPRGTPGAVRGGVGGRSGRGATCSHPCNERRPTGRARLRLGGVVPGGVTPSALPDGVSAAHVGQGVG